MLRAVDRFPIKVDLAPGEEILTRVVLSSKCQIAVTNQRIILWEWKGGVESFVPLKLSDVYEVEVIEKKGPPRPLVGALILSLGGAALLPFLVTSLTNLREGIRISLFFGLIGFGLLVWGLWLLAGYLKGALFPGLVLVFRGSPELRVELGSRLPRRVVEMVRLVQQLKERTR